jgi:hypothetical protein
MFLPDLGGIMSEPELLGQTVVVIGGSAGIGLDSWAAPAGAASVTASASASLLGDQLEERRHQLRATLPIGRVVEAADVAALAVHLMTNTALTGATSDIDGGQQFV